MAGTPALKIDGLKKTYPGKKGQSVEALKGVSLTVDEGEFFALLGPNGAGKTTLIGITAGLVTKSEGSVEVMGSSIDTDPTKAKAHIGLVPQEFNFNIFEKVFDIVVDQAGYYGIPQAEARTKAEEILKELGLWEKRNQPSQSLSGGMKRRLMIARALIHSPKVLLLDEPTAGVDVELRRGMWDYLKRLNTTGTTIILTTHYLEEAEQLCKRVAIINKGEIIEEGSVKSLLTKYNVVTLQLDAVEPIKEAALHLLSDLEPRRVDETTVELTLKQGETVNEVIRRFSAVGVQLANVRNAGNRLEEVFMNLITK